MTGPGQVDPMAFRRFGVIRLDVHVRGLIQGLGELRVRAKGGNESRAVGQPGGGGPEFHSGLEAGRFLARPSGRSGP
jgi:hypothetical protein